MLYIVLRTVHPIKSVVSLSVCADAIPMVKEKKTSIAFFESEYSGFYFVVIAKLIQIIQNILKKYECFFFIFQWKINF